MNPGCSTCGPTGADAGAAYGYGAGCAGDSAYSGGSCYGSDAAACGVAYPSCAAPAPPSAVWSFSLGALYLQRDHGNNYAFSYDDPNEDLQYLNQRDADFSGGMGFETRLARYDACTKHGLELVYWQLLPTDEEAMVLGSSLAGNLSAILNYDQLDYSGATADNFTNNAFAHRLRREMDVYNVEANHGIVLTDACGSGATVASLVGFRLFRFDERLQFASDPNDSMFTYETDELYYDIDTQNLLVGCQLGGSVNRPMTGCFSLTAVAKAGVFGNFCESSSRISGAAGTATINNGPNNGASWMVSNDKVDVAMMAEMALGFAYQPTRRWRLTADYRVIGVSGVALPTNQIYHDLRGINDVALLQTNGHVILHGAYLGMERCF
ncbi:BBP7 family outer membrane beta-barrel protein [Posidoniimonas polymericola]|uniref:BBP7 family outer membrane beta-barrel protein n=1 Tax=Posidoniimonas polymericola TaxID=2528002 RepID=UPI001E31ED72|nr:BBP7 family outer membrane beta-barrel protein [Posidoniimonas polymericola]